MRASWLVVTGNAVVCAGTFAFAIAFIPQQPAARTLSSPDATLAQAFSGVDGVRELRDGRVIVLDYRDRRIYAVNLQTGGVGQVGRTGQGPGEYQLPMRLLPLPGDSTAVVDMANSSRLLVLTSQATAAGSLAASDGARGTARISERSALDGRGRVYSENRATTNDSIGIERWDRSAGRRDIVAYYSGRVVSPLLAPRPSGGRSGGAASGGARSGGPIPPLASRDLWAVAPDGRVAIVTVDPYRVTFVDQSGNRSASQLLPFDRIRVSEHHKRLWREEKQRPVATLISSGGGQMSATFAPPRYTEPAEWPEYLPPFLDGAVRFAPDGMLWVERTTEAGGAPLFDVINPQGRVVARVQAPRRTRLVGFGAGSVYLVRIDDDELEYLQRYRLPY